ncbi:hypothetical protein [Ekhidna sp.]
MRTFLVVILALLINDPKEIAKINALKKEAETAFLAKDYELAISKYTLLSDSLGIEDPAVKLNLAHAHYHLGDTAGAVINYGKLSNSENKELKSIAMQQMGIISKEAGKLEESLQLLKSSIKADNNNNDARYNYEVVKKLLENQRQQDNQDQQNQDGDSENEEDIIPSEYAKAMKKRADELRYQGKFKDAYDTMIEAYSNDRTVKAYEKYIEKLKKIIS